MKKINARTQLAIQRKLKNRSNDAVGNMGFSLSSIFGNYYDNMTDYAVGADYITRFFNSSYNTGRKISAYTYVITLRQNLGASIADSQIRSLGTGIKLAELSESTVQEAADELAKLADGKVPATIGDFRQALIGQATATPFTDAVVQSAVVQGFQKVGDTLITAADTVVSLAESTVVGTNMISKVLSYVPFVLPIALAYGTYKLINSDFVKGTAQAVIKKRLGA